MSFSGLHTSIAALLACGFEVSGPHKPRGTDAAVMISDAPGLSDQTLSLFQRLTKFDLADQHLGVLT